MVHREWSRIINQNMCATVDGERQCRTAPPTLMRRRSIGEKAGAWYASSIEEKSLQKTSVGIWILTTTKFPKQRSVKERRRIVFELLLKMCDAVRCDVVWLLYTYDRPATTSWMQRGAAPLNRNAGVPYRTVHKSHTRSRGLCYLVFEQTTVLYISRYSLYAPT